MGCVQQHAVNHQHPSKSAVQCSPMTGCVCDLREHVLRRGHVDLAAGGSKVRARRSTRIDRMGCPPSCSFVWPAWRSAHPWRLTRSWCRQRIRCRIRRGRCLYAPRPAGAIGALLTGVLSGDPGDRAGLVRGAGLACRQTSSESPLGGLINAEASIERVGLGAVVADLHAAGVVDIDIVVRGVLCQGE